MPSREDYLKSSCPEYFKYLNRDSDGNRWWMYTHVMGRTIDGMVFTHTFQKRKNGTIIFEHVYYYTRHVYSDFLPSSEEEFERERQLMLEELQEF